MLLGRLADHSGADVHSTAYRPNCRVDERDMFVDLEDPHLVSSLPLYSAVPTIRVAGLAEFCPWSGPIPGTNDPVCLVCNPHRLPASCADACAEAFAWVSPEAAEVAAKLPAVVGCSVRCFGICAYHARDGDAREGGIGFMLPKFGCKCDSLFGSRFSAPKMVVVSLQKSNVGASLDDSTFGSRFSTPFLVVETLSVSGRRWHFSGGQMAPCGVLKNQRLSSTWTKRVLPFICLA